MSKILHIYGSEGPHGAINIAGTIDALAELRNILDVAIGRHGVASMTPMTSDGEQYPLVIRKVGYEAATHLASHYTDQDMFPEQNPQAWHPWETGPADDASPA